MFLVTVTILLFFYAILCIKKPGWALYLIPLLLPSYLIRFKIGFVPFTFMEILILIFILFWFIKKLHQGELLKYLQSVKNNKITFFAILLFLASTISIFTSPDKIAALGIWKAYFVIPIIFYFVLVDLVKTDKDIKNILRMLGFSALILSIYAIVQYFTGLGMPVTYSYEGLSRATSIFTYPAALGLFVAPIFTVLCSLLILSGRSEKDIKLFRNDTLLIVILTIMALALIASRAEGAWIGVLVALFFTTLFTKYRWHIILITSIFLLVIFLIPVTRDYVWPLITFQDVSGDVRLAIWQGTCNLLKNHPIFGAGLAGFQTYYAQYKEAKHIEISLYPHNMFLNFWVETGILGLIAFLSIIYWYFKKGFTKIFRKRKDLQITNYKISLLSVMVCVLVYGLVDVPYFKNDLSVLFWIWIGLITIVNQNKILQD